MFDWNDLRHFLAVARHGSTIAAARNLNLSQSTVLQQQTLENVLTPVANPDPLNQELRIKVSGGWTANEGDVLEAIATYKVTAGVYTDYSAARSGTVVVSA